MSADAPPYDLRTVVEVLTALRPDKTPVNRGEFVQAWIARGAESKALRNAALTRLIASSQLRDLGTSVQIVEAAPAVAGAQQPLIFDRALSERASALHENGMLLVEKEQHSAAFPMLKSALEMRIQLYRDGDHPDLAQSLEGTGQVLCRLGQAQHGLTMLIPALDIRRRLHRGSDHADLAA